MQKFNCFQSRWNNITPEENESMQKAGYVIITRPATYWGLKKGRGQMVTAYSVKPNMLPISVRSIAQEIVNNYQ